MSAILSLPGTVVRKARQAPRKFVHSARTDPRTFLRRVSDVCIAAGFLSLLAADVFKTKATTLTQCMQNATTGCPTHPTLGMLQSATSAISAWEVTAMVIFGMLFLPTFLASWATPARQRATQ